MPKPIGNGVARPAHPGAGVVVSEAIDFAAEGLLKGVRGRRREARRKLLAELAADGVPLEELRRAVEEDRLALLPVERELAGGAPRYTADQIAELSGLDRGFLDRQWRALGMALPAEDEVAYTEADLEAAQRIATLIATGVPEEGAIEFGRVVAIAMSQVAAANRLMVGEAILRPGDTELDVARRLEAAARTLVPMQREGLAYVVNLHLREQLRHDVLGAEQAAAGRIGQADEVTVCFADLVGFTRLGEGLPPEELGTVTGRLMELASEVAVPPVRLVKMLGDAAMLVSPQTDPLLDAALSVVGAAEGEGAGFPLLRAGVARGQALTRGGDWYGRPVNLASRVTGVAYPGSVLATAEVREAAGAGYRWSDAGRKRLKGIERAPRLYRVRRALDRGAEPAGATDPP